VATAVWRIARRRHALDRRGVGARNGGGRWNHVGTGVIYAGCTIAIAALEKFVHLAGIVPPDLVLARLQLPEPYSAERPTLAELPADWNIVPPARGSMELGSRWARERRSLVLYVPSALVPEECNAVLNPDHPEFPAVTMVIERDFSYDDRMYLSRARR